MTNGEMDKLKNELKKTQKQIEEYQQNCKHNEIIVNMVGQDSGVKIVKQCKECDKIVGYPTQEETQKYLNNKK